MPVKTKVLVILAKKMWTLLYPHTYVTEKKKQFFLQRACVWLRTEKRNRICPSRTIGRRRALISDHACNYPYNPPSHDKKMRNPGVENVARGRRTGNDALPLFSDYTVKFSNKHILTIYISDMHIWIENCFLLTQ